MTNPLLTTDTPVLTALPASYDAISDLVFYKDLEGLYLGCNHAFYEFFGKENESDIIGITDYDLFDQKLADFFREEDLTVLSENTTKHSEQRVAGVDGNSVRLSFFKMPFRDSEGHVLGILGISHELIERHQEYTAIQPCEVTQQESLQKYQLLFEFSRDALLIMSPPSWNFSEVNQAALGLFGASSLADFSPLRFWGISPPRQPDGSLSSDQTQENIAIALREGSTFFEWEYQQLDGTPFFSDVKLTRMDIGEGVFLHCVIRNISERKRVEEALQESEEKYRRLFELSEDPMWLIVDDRFVIANQSSAQLLGYETVEALTDSHPSKFSPEFQADGQSSYEKANAMMAIAYREGYHRFEWTHKKSNAETFLVEVSLTRIPYGGDEALFCIWRDITERKLADIELAEKETQFHSLVENIPGSTYRCLLDEHWTMLFVSNAIQTLSGYPASDFIGDNPVRTFAEIIHPDDTQAVWENVNQAVIDERYFINEYRIIDNQGLTHDVYEKGQAIYADNGSAKYLDGTIFDITERKKLESLEKFRADILEIIASEDSLSVVLDGISRSVEQRDSAMLCSVLLLDDDGAHLLNGAATSLPDDYQSAIHGLAVGMGVGSCGTAAFTGKRVIVEDVQTHPYWTPFKELTKNAGLRACWSEPICSSQGGILGTFAIYHANPHQPTDADIALIEQVAHLASIAIEKHQASQALKSSEERWAFAIEGSGDGVWDWDIPSDKMIYSTRWKEMLGYAEDEVPTNNQEWRERIHSEDRQAVYEAIQTCLDGRRPKFEVKYRLRGKDSGCIWVLARGMVVSSDHNNKPLRMVGTHSDITEIKISEDKLKLAASVFSHASEGIVITDSAGSIIEVNDTFSKITGYSRNEVIGKNPKILQSGRQTPAFYAEMWATLLQEGTWTGEVWNRRKSGEVYAELLTISAVHNSTGKGINYVALFTDITENKANQKQLQRMAHYDVLTNLPNRVLLADRLEQAIHYAKRQNHSVAVVFLDLDGFKEINDVHGHHVGDNLLVEVSCRLKECLRDADTLSRFGGDEFVAVLADIEKIQDCELILERFLNAASAPVAMRDVVLKVSASIGVTIYPQDGSDSDVLIRHADQAMYTAKLEGKNRYHLFDTEHDVAVKTQRESVQDIRAALNKSEFELYYQPKVNMKTGAIIGAEALIRWQHPDRGLVAPNDFLPAIENHDLSIELGEWVIDTALSQITAWQDLNLPLRVSVNISAFQLQKEGFTARLATLLAKHPTVAPVSLELEVLETSRLNDVEGVAEIMRACIELGVSFSLDDFGTGYSSLTYLRRLPARQIKIDQSFVRDMLIDPDDLAIVEGVIGLAKSFKREVIAEGVETIEHGSELLQLGCDLAQGYGIARPMQAKDLPEWVEKWRPDASWSA